MTSLHSKSFFPCDKTCPVWWGCSHKPTAALKKKCEHRPAAFCKLHIPDSNDNGIAEISRQERVIRLSVIDGGD